MSFAKRNGIKHISCAPYCPSSNGTAEPFVQTFKKAMKASRDTSLTHALRFLLTYCITPHATTNEAPCQLFISYSLTTKLGTNSISKASKSGGQP